MKIGLIKFVDTYFGLVLCLVLGLFKRKKAINKEHVSTIAFIQLWGVGESITTLPAIKALKKAYPQSEITVIGTTRVESVFQGQSFIDHLLLVSLNPVSLFIFIVKHWNTFDLVIDFEEYLTISALMSYGVGKQSIGYGNQTRSRLHDWIIAYNDKQHVAQTHMDLLQGLGIHQNVERLERVHIPEESRSAVQRMLDHAGVKKGLLIGIAPGAAESSQSRMWPIARYASIAAWLVRTYNAEVVLSGNKKEVRLCRDLLSFIETEQKKKIHLLTGKTTIHELYALIDRLGMLLCNDSGPMHMGSCLGVKTVSLFGPNLPVRFGGLGKHCINIYKGQVCKYSPCINVHKGQIPECLWGKHHKNNKICMKEINIVDVKRAVEVLL